MRQLWETYTKMDPAITMTKKKSLTQLEAFTKMSLSGIKKKVILKETMKM